MGASIVLTAPLLASCNSTPSPQPNTPSAPTRETEPRESPTDLFKVSQDDVRSCLKKKVEVAAEAKGRGQGNLASFRNRAAKGGQGVFIALFAAEPTFGGGIENVDFLFFTPEDAEELAPQLKRRLDRGQKLKRRGNLLVVLGKRSRKQTQFIDECIRAAPSGMAR
jgi:hypothetical protein